MEEFPFPNSKLRKVNFTRKSITYKDVKCQHGKPTFGKEDVPFSKIIENYNKLNSLGCKNDTYPVYDENGNHCCEEQQMTPQELFDYINMLLRNVEQNMSQDASHKYIPFIDYLLTYRRHMLANYSNLRDNLEDDLINNVIELRRYGIQEKRKKQLESQSKGGRQYKKKKYTNKKTKRNNKRKNSKKKMKISNKIGGYPKDDEIMKEIHNYIYERAQNKDNKDNKLDELIKKLSELKQKINNTDKENRDPLMKEHDKLMNKIHGLLYARTIIKSKKEYEEGIMKHEDEIMNKIHNYIYKRAQKKTDKDNKEIKDNKLDTLINELVNIHDKQRKSQDEDTLKKEHTKIMNEINEYFKTFIKKEDDDSKKKEDDDIFKK